MLKKFFNSIFPGTSYPQSPYTGGVGFNGIPPQVGFNQVLGGLNSPVGFPGATLPYGAPGLGTIPQAGFFGLGPQTLQAYNNVQSKSPRQNLRNQALAPGAALISTQTQAKPPQQTIPSQQGFIGQSTPFGYGNGFAPSQAFGQGAMPFGYGNAYGPSQTFGQGAMPFAPYGSPFLQKAQILLFPIISLFGLVKSLFGLGRFFGIARPIKVNEEDTSYSRFTDYVSESYVPGGFDEPFPFDGETLEKQINIEKLDTGGYF